MSKILTSDEVGVIADQTICGDDVKRPFYHWDDCGDEDSRYLIDFANKILAVYGSVPDPLSLVTVQREAWDAGARFRMPALASVLSPGTMSLNACDAECDRRFPLPAPPAPEPVLSEADVERLSNDLIADSSQAFIRLVERVVLTTQQERAK